MRTNDIIQESYDTLMLNGQLLPHDILMKRVSEKIADGSLLRLIASFLTAPIQDGYQQRVP